MRRLLDFLFCLLAALMVLSLLALGIVVMLAFTIGRRRGARPGPAEEGTPMKRAYRKWTHDEDAQLLFLREHARMQFGDIDGTMELRKGAACDRYRVLRPKPYRIAIAPGQQWTQNIVERAAALARQIACHAPPPASPPSLTAAFFGDPPPGRSALDKKLAGMVP